MADTPKHSVSVAGIVVDDQDRILVIQRRDNGQWEPPGGVLELDETPEEGVRREVFEETGVKVDVESLSGVYKNMSRGIIALVFRCHPSSGRPTTSHETVNVIWMTASEVEDRMDPAYAVRVRDALSLRSAAARTHDGVHLLDAPAEVN